MESRCYRAHCCALPLLLARVVIFQSFLVARKCPSALAFFLQRRAQSCSTCQVLPLRAVYVNNSLDEPSVQAAYAVFLLNCAHFVAPCGTLAILCLRRPIARLSSAWSALSFEDQKQHLTLHTHANSAPLNINADHCL